MMTTTIAPKVAKLSTRALDAVWERAHRALFAGELAPCLEALDALIAQAQAGNVHPDMLLDHRSIGGGATADLVAERVKIFNDFVERRAA